MSSKSADFLPDWRPEDPTPGNRLAAFVMIALALVAGAILFGLTMCHREVPIQMLPSPMPAASSAASATSSATATGRFRAIIPIGVLKPALDVAPQARRAGDPWQSILLPGLSSKHSQSLGKAPSLGASRDEDPGSIVIEFEQVLTAASSSSAQINNPTGSRPTEPLPTHGRMGVVALTAPGLLAADWQLARVGVPPWVVGTPLEVGLDLEGNLQHIGVGVTAGEKGFAFAGYWIGYNLIQHGPSIGVGLRF